jgi:hypothetical protein
VSTATFGWGSAWATAAANGRPWAETTTASSQCSPARAKATAGDDGAGWISSPSAPKRAEATRTMPKNPGSPDARRQTRSPRARRSAA